MLFLYRFFLGILEIEIYGVYPEKFLNLCSQNNISIWDIGFKKGKISCKITVRDFKKLPKIFKKQGVRLHITKKQGLPFFFDRYKHRFGIVAGLILFFAVLQVLSSFIWVIEVNGNKTVESGEILKICQEIGITVGMKKGDLDAKNKAQEMLLKSDKLSWGSFNIEGCRLTVDVTEIAKEDEGDFLASNLLADSDGIIKHIDVTVGNCVVKVGDTVAKGDVLVSGISENEQGTKFVRSRGKIIAETTTEIELKQDFNIKKEYFVGKPKTKTVLEILRFKLPLYLGAEKGEYDSEYSVKPLKLFKNELPIKLHKRRFLYKKSETVKIDFQTACEELDKRLEKEYPNAQKTREFFENQDGAVLKAIIKEERDICTPQSLIFSVGK